jgi:hypothetical protein
MPDQLDEFDPDEYNDYGRGTMGHVDAKGKLDVPPRLLEPFKCPGCARQLQRIVPLVMRNAAGWEWRLVPDFYKPCALCGMPMSPEEFAGQGDPPVHGLCGTFESHADDARG